MSSYKDFEKTVFSWLIQKNNLDPSFTFSLRQKATKGAETDYFIGTENSKYFSTTFWTIPVAYPSASSDLINLSFKLSKGGYSYSFQFQQTNNPSTKQNAYALELLQILKIDIRALFNRFGEGDPENKLEYFYCRSPKQSYDSIHKMLLDVENDLNKLIPLVDTKIAQAKSLYPNFEAERISKADFNTMITGFSNRIEKYKHLESNMTNNNLETTPNSNSSMPLNQILFGPPGTGKTYNTINKAISIANPSFNLLGYRSDIQNEFNRLVEVGQIVFTTFHQSMSYEDFIEGIKPDTINNRITYNIKDGIFKNLCKSAILPNQVDFNAAYDKLKQDLIEVDILKLKTPTGKEFSISLNSNDNLSLYTGPQMEKQGTLTKENVQKQISGETKFIGWESYFNGVVNHLKSNYGYSTEPKNSIQNFVLIIDEINRGNISQIFGELITLIEDDKRLGQAGALRVKLPYSKDEFGIPSNLYIIGTMNTADRSVEALDAALRRRFIFEEMPPRPELVSPQYKIWDLWWKYEDIPWVSEPFRSEEIQLNTLLGITDDFDPKQELWERMKDEGISQNQIKYFDKVVISGINLEKVLVRINKRIERLLDKDHQIGHSYFMSVNSIEELKVAFQNKIIPLLQEYFFGDYGKIGLVLGEGFFEKFKIEESGAIFSKFFEYSSEDFEGKEIYRLKDVSKMEENEMKEAIQKLLV